MQHLCFFYVKICTISLNICTLDSCYMGSSNSNKEYKRKVSSREDSIQGIIKGALFLMETELTKKLEEIQKSEALFKIGEKTDLVKHIEGMLQDPLNNVYSSHNQVSHILRDIIHILTISFFKQNENIINSVWKLETNAHHLHYSIVLKEDTHQNRESILRFFDHYDLFPVSQGCPIYFQFLPIELVSQLKNIEQVDYAEPFESSKA